MKGLDGVAYRNKIRQLCSACGHHRGDHVDLSGPCLSFDVPADDDGPGCSCDAYTGEGR